MILLFGPTGAGKSMQGQMLAVRQGWKWLSTGEMLRSSSDPEVIRLLKTGELINDELTYEVFTEAVADAKRRQFPNIIVDGFPRTKAQAAWLSGYLEETKQQIDLVVALEVPEAEIMQRLAKRQRMEDTPETIARRMTIYRQKMYPVLGTFAEDGVKIVHIDGTGPAGEVHDRIYNEVSSVCQI
ncbi:nucleoside monophosphate kinase [Candidatus Saccharibacteria bacterium]|nr:nucleoside monophosphate kinase [Candidatus Saccharibacteria bacterium]